jgi:hypothetical protein
MGLSDLKLALCGELEAWKRSKESRFVQGETWCFD